jgi:hypothetical protein
MLLSLASSGQIKKIDLPEKKLVGGTASAGDIYLAIECYKYEDGTYLFKYSDANYPELNEWKTFTLKSTEDFESLYSYIKKGFEEMPKKKVLLDIGGEYLSLDFSRYLVQKAVRLSHSNTPDEDLGDVGYTKLLTAKQIDRLFGKR